MRKFQFWNFDSLLKRACSTQEPFFFFNTKKTAFIAFYQRFTDLMAETGRPVMINRILDGLSSPWIPGGINFSIDWFIWNIWIVVSYKWPGWSSIRQSRTRSCACFSEWNVNLVWPPAAINDPNWHLLRWIYKMRPMNEMKMIHRLRIVQYRTIL